MEIPRTVQEALQMDECNDISHQRDAINKEIISFLFKGVIPQENQNTITEAKRATHKQKLNLSKEYLPALVLPVSLSVQLSDITVLAESEVAL